MNITPIASHRISSEDNRLLQAWHNGELDASAADALERRFFFEPALAEAASIDQDIREGLSFLDHQRPVARTPRAERLWTLLAAASLGAVAVLVPVAYQSLDQTPPPVLGNVEWVRLDHTRSSASTPTLVNPSAETGAIIIEVPAPEGTGPFEARVVSSNDGEVPLTAQQLLPLNGALTIVVPRGALKGGRYTVEISSRSSAKPAVSLPFRFEP